MSVILEEILAEAAKAKASDVHITVGAPPRMRVGGKLFPMAYPQFMPEDTLEVLISVMPEAERERFEGQGECGCAFSISGLGRFRVSAYRQQGCVALAIRLMGEHIPSPGELGIPASVVELCQKEAGLILLTGESGSGRSSTAAVLLDQINSMREVHIITLESPIEYIHGHKQSLVEQREVGCDCTGYSQALRALLREDPDVVFVSEIADPQTGEGVLRAAETGHLVLASIDASGAEAALERLVLLFSAKRQQEIRGRLADVLEAVVSQQFLPRKEREGRVAAFGLLHTTKAIRALIREGKIRQISAVMEKEQYPGAVTMDDAVEKLFKEGKISREAIMAYAYRNRYV